MGEGGGCESVEFGEEVVGWLGCMRGAGGVGVWRF